MTRDEATRRLKSRQTELKRLGVERLYLFGSIADGRGDEGSDVDLFFDHQTGSLGLYELMDLKEIATSILGCRTDIMTRESLHPTLRRRIEEAAVLVF
jgi:uncharacterized protein